VTTESLTEAQLADRAGLSLDRLRTLVELGILEPGADGTFREKDVPVVRLCLAFEEGGISMQAVGRAIAEGHFSFAFAEFLFREEWQGFTEDPFEEVCRQYGAEPAFVQQVFSAAGLPVPALGDRMRVDDAERIPNLTAPLSMGSGDPAVILRALRIYGENLHRVAEAEPHFYHMLLEEPLLKSGMSERQIRETVAAVSHAIGDVAERAVMWIYRRHQEHATVEHLLEHLYDLMEKTGLEQRADEHPPAICFLDLAGYTRLTEEQGDEAAAQTAASLSELVHHASGPHQGRPVKWLGDGVMFHFHDAAGAVTAALEMVDRVPGEGLPPAHVGIAAGPVIARDGDFFGRTVNAAARIAGYAGPGQVLVTDEVMEGAPSHIAFEHVGDIRLKGMSKPLTLHRAIHVG
jgi:adenylate cyclase